MSKNADAKVPEDKLTEEERFWQKCVDLCLQEHFYNKDCYPFLPRTEHERQAFEEFYSNPANVPEKTVPRRGRALPFAGPLTPFPRGAEKQARKTVRKSAQNVG